MIPAVNSFRNRTSYGAAGQVTKSVDAKGDATVFTYNDAGQRASTTDASGVMHYFYDARDRPQNKATPNEMLSYTYDESGDIKTVRSNHANGVSVDYSYDESNRLSTVKR